MKIFNANLSDQDIAAKVNKLIPQVMKKEAVDPSSQEIADQQKAIKLSEDFNKGFTDLGQYTTSIASTVFNQVMEMSRNEDPIISRVRGEYQDSQKVWMNIRSAQAGFAEGGTFGSPVDSVTTTARSGFSVSTGFFGSKVNLSLDELALYRETESLDGSYAPEAMRRAITQCVINMYQRQRLVVARTITNNAYTYYTDGTISDVISYGRLASSDYDLSTGGGHWQTINTTTGEVTDNLSAEPILDLINLFTNQENTIIRNTRPFLRGLLMNPEEARVLTKIALNTGNAMDATAFMAALNKGTYDPEDIIRSNVPALKDVDIYIYDGMVNNSVDETNGVINSKEYIIPTGYIVPIIDYEDVGMGTMVFTPEPRKAWMYGASALPTGALDVSDPRAAYMRVVSSLQDPRSETPYWFCEAGARFAFCNPIAASTSYIIKTAAYTS